MALDASVEHQTAKNAQRLRNAAEIAVSDKCVSEATDDRAACKNAILSASEEQLHDEYDLGAQRSMATWTRAMGQAAIIGMAVGILGLGLIFVTFSETRSAAQTAKRQTDLLLAQIAPNIRVGCTVFLQGQRLWAHLTTENRGSGEAESLQLTSVRLSIPDCGILNCELEGRADRDEIRHVGINGSSFGWDLRIPQDTLRPHGQYLWRTVIVEADWTFLDILKQRHEDGSKWEGRFFDDPHFEGGLRANMLLRARG